MTWLTPETRLGEIRTKLAEKKEVEPVPVRTFLRWFGASRRGFWVVRNIEQALKEAGLQTRPDFNAVHIDSQIRFELIQLPVDETAARVDKNESHAVIEPTSTTIAIVAGAPALIAGANADPAFRIGRLASANAKPLSVTPDTTLVEAVTLMLRNDYSQLPVMTNDRDVKGVISWETIGAPLALKKEIIRVRDCMRPHHEVLSNESLFRVIAVIVEQSYVLVRGEDRTITGIVTTSDLSLQFQQLSEPFLLLSEIENHVRVVVDGKFTAKELTDATDGSDPERTIESVADLTFGEYIRLLENPINWAKTGLAVDRAIFVRELDKVRRIRNDVMHFDPDGITDEDHLVLRHFVQFMHEVRALSR